jgi:hypothetical protein
VEMVAWWGRVRSRSAGIVMAGAVLASVISVPGAAADPLDGVTSPYAPLPGSEAAAAIEARRSGEPVEASALRTETSTTWVKPDGTSRLQITALPQRVRKPDGAWADIDLSLVKRADGRLAPKAGPADVAFSGGGDTALASYVSKDTRSTLHLGWQGTLPAPTVSGDSATYPEVFPGVDLKVTAELFGFSEVLVVKTAEAARNPTLSKIQFTTRADGVTLRSDGQNGADAVDAAGRTVFRANSPKMWDSSGEQPATGPRRTQMEPLRQTEMPMEVGSGTLTITPDQTMLQNPETRFPVYIDPTITDGRTHWGYIDQAHPGQACWDNSCKNGDGDPYPPRAGRYGGAGAIRSMFAMDTTQLPKGSYVGGAQFTITGTWTPNWSCSVKVGVELRLTGGINGNETWNNFSGAAHWSTLQDTASASLGHEGCGARSLEFNVLDGARKAAAAGWRSATFGLKAPSGREDDSDWWMRFKLDPELTIHYNRRPHQPSQLKVGGKTCSTTTWPLIGKMSGRQAPVVSARATDPDANKGQKITGVEFEWGTYDPVTKTMTPKGNPRDTHDDVSGRTWQTAIPQNTAASLADGTYYVKARAYDTWKVNEQGVSYWSNPCYFKVDATVPDEEVTITPVPGEGETEPVYTPDVWGGGINKPGTFEVKAPTVGAGNDIAFYRWSFGSSEPTNQVPAGTDPDRTARIRVTPSQFGPAVLYVRGYDAAGNTDSKHSLFSITILVNPPDCGDGAYRPCPAMSAGFWTMGEGSGSVSQDLSGRNHPLMFGPPAYWAEGRPGLGRAIGFDGVRACGNTSTTVTACPNNPGAKVPIIRTDQSFTVSAWVKLGSLPDRNMAVLSQNGTHTAGFSLYYKTVSATEKRWTFLMNQNDVATTAPNYVARRSISTSDYPAEVGVWTHLVGVYDSVDGTLSLYVNGNEAGETDVIDTNGFRPAFNATGSLQVGRAWFNDKYLDPLDGVVQDVHVYPGAIDKQMILGESNPAVRLPGPAAF